MSLQPRNPEWETYVREMFATEGYMHHLGTELVRLEPGFAELRVPFTDALSQHHGFFHGGVVGGVLDNAGGAAVGTLAPAGASILTVEYKVNFVRAAAGEILIARGNVIRAGRLMTAENRAYIVDDDGAETLVATALQTVAVKILS